MKQEKAEGLLKFIDKLVECNSVSQYLTVFEGDLLKSIDFRKYANFNEEYYTRNLLYENPDFELMLVCWCNEQKSAIHDHANSECVMICVDGLLQENLYSRKDSILDYKASRVLTVFKPVNINNAMGIHEIYNINSGGSLSLHLYSPKISTCKIYKGQTSKPIEMKTTFSTRLID